MPKFLEDKLAAEAAKKGKTGRAADRYIYGAMNNMGAMHGNQETAKGARMEAKHEADMGHPHRNLGKYLHKKKAAPARDVESHGALKRSKPGGVY